IQENRRPKMKTGAFFLAVAISFAQSSLDVTTGLDGMLDGYLTEIAKSQWAARSARMAEVRTPDDVRKRQEYIRNTMLAEIGGFPEKTPLNARITGKLDRDGYTVEKLIFESQPGLYVTASVFVPKTGTPPYPAVLGAAGHSLDGK